MRKGFTIAELLIVITVISILATITIVSYTGFQNRAYDASVQGDLESIAGELESYRTRANDLNPAQQFPSTATHLQSLGIQVAKGTYDTAISANLVYCVKTTDPNAYQEYALIAQSKSDNVFLVTQDGFKSHSITPGSLGAGLCTTLGMTWVSNGMSSPGTWVSWARTAA